MLPLLPPSSTRARNTVCTPVAKRTAVHFLQKKEKTPSTAVGFLPGSPAVCCGERTQIRAPLAACRTSELFAHYLLSFVVLRTCFHGGVEAPAYLVHRRELLLRAHLNRSQARHLAVARTVLSSLELRPTGRCPCPWAPCCRGSENTWRAYRQRRGDRTNRIVCVHTQSALAGEEISYVTAVTLLLDLAPATKTHAEQASAPAHRWPTWRGVM